jgi:hypothetical protein
MIRLLPSTPWPEAVAVSLKNFRPTPRQQAFLHT